MWFMERGGWRAPEDTWMDMEEAEEEVFFVNTLRAGVPDSDEELEAEIARMEKAIDDCFQRRAKRAGVGVDMPEDRLMSESERDCLSEKLGDWPGVQAKRRKEIKEMREKAIGNEIKKTEEILRKRAGATGTGPRSRRSGLGSLLLTMAILCLIGEQVRPFTSMTAQTEAI
jgi:hypothetical protein